MSACSGYAATRSPVTSRLAGSLLLGLVLFLGAEGLEGQSLEARIDRVSDGEVMFRFDARPGVYRCGDRHEGWMRTDPSEPMDWGNWRREDCVTGPVWVWMRLDDGEPEELRSRLGGFDGRRSGQDLGEVTPAEAADYLMEVAGVAERRVAERALGSAVIADGVDLGPRLLELARDVRRPQNVRTSAVFWLGQAVTEVALDGLRDIVEDDADMEVREAAVFAISQRDQEEAFPVLRDLALSDAHTELRKSAFFWLAQMDDPRVLELFEEILAR